MCSKYAHTVPAIGVCLLSGIVCESSCSWIPPQTPIARADSTALGTIAELTPISLWPGETRHITLPPFTPKPGTTLQYEIRGDPGVAMRVGGESAPYAPIVRGTILVPKQTVAPPLPLASTSTPLVGPAVPAPTAPPNLTAPSSCVVRVDPLAPPGDTIVVRYTISTTTQPPRKSTWRLRVLVTAAPSHRSARDAPIDKLTIHPNPCNPSTTVSFRVSGPASVRLDVFDVTGQLVAQADRRVTGYKTDSITWYGTDTRGRSVPSGVYLLRVQSGKQVHTLKVVVVK